MSELPEHVARNRATGMISRGSTSRRVNAVGHKRSPRGASGRFRRRRSKFFPGTWPARMLSSWDVAPPTFPRRSHGAEPVSLGIDNSEGQLGTARRLQGQYGLDSPLIHGDAEAIGYPEASFDFAISEYGACLWVDPERWLPESARLLCPGGQLVFLTNSFLITLCMPTEDEMAATERLLRPAFGMYRVEWPGSLGVEFHLSHGDWIRLLRRSGFEVEDLIEVRPAVGATSSYPFVSVE